MRITAKYLKSVYDDGTYGLRDVNLDIGDGKFAVVVGPSGCGKTTLLRMIAGFNSIEGGDFYFGEKRINDVPAHKRDIGMVFQNYAICTRSTPCGKTCRWHLNANTCRERKRKRA